MRETEVKTNNGITLIALVITIIVLLILAGVSIAMLTGDNGVLTQANKAKINTEIADEKETVELAAISAMSKEAYGEITEVKLDEELNKRSGEGKYSTDLVDEGIAVTFLESKRTYLVETDGNVVADYKLKLPEPDPEVSTVASFTMSYGVIEVEFLSEIGYRVTAIPNTPILKDGMEGVYWTDSTGVINTSNPQSNTVEVKQGVANYNAENWYSYTAQTEANDGKTSRWANATTSDGSYYVWIPRYAYRIVYFNNQTNENAYRAGTLTEEEALEKGYIKGYSDARGIVDKDGKRPTSITSTTAISVNDKYFRTHPVFDGKVDEGGWDTKLRGIWVMKYSASRSNATATSEGSGTTPKSVPNVKAWIRVSLSQGFISARDVYNKDNQLNTTLNSHIMKNSEWGAVAYLTESNYGRNGKELSINQSTDKITGVGKGIGDNAIYNERYTWSQIDETQKYTGIVGQLSSSTGNIYGIYDLSSLFHEYVIGFYQDEEENIYTGYSDFNGWRSDGSKKEDGIDLPTNRKYYQLYKNATNNIYTIDGGMLGDAIKETKNWNEDCAVFLSSGAPTISRGGGHDKAEPGKGTYGYWYMNGSANVDVGFRVCLAII